MELITNTIVLAAEILLGNDKKKYFQISGYGRLFTPKSQGNIIFAASSSNMPQKKEGEVKLVRKSFEFPVEEPVNLREQKMPNL